MAKKATAKPKTRRSPPRAPKTQDRLADAPMPLTSAPAGPPPEPATAEVTIGGPIMGYRDGKEGVETKVFVDGKMPKGWHDTPAKCKKDYRAGMVTIA